MQVSYSAVICMVVPYLRLTTLITQSKKLERWTNISVFVAFFFVGTVWLTDWFIKDLYYFQFGLYPKVGWIHPFFLGWLFTSMALIHLMLFLGFKDEKRDSSSRNQAKYIWLAFIAVTPVIVDFIPNYGIRIYPAGFLFVLIFGVVSAYAIVRHQLMDIEVVIKRTAVFAGLFAFVYGVFMVFTILGQRFFQSTLGWNQWTAMIPTVLVITFSLRPLEIFLTNATERFLFQKKYDYRELLRTFTNEILTVLDLQKLMDQTIAGLMKIIKLESACVLLLNDEKKVYEKVAASGLKEKEIMFFNDDALITTLKASGQAILKDKNVDKMGESHLKDNFKRLNAQLCLPLLLHDNLIGVLCLGMKKSGGDYTQEDIDILTTLARTEAIAISNARLFDELSKTQAEAAQREKMAVIGTLAAGINHEICNPLGIVRGQCEMFLLNLRDGFYKGTAKEEIIKISSEIMNKVIKETDRATSITKKLSSFAKPAKQSSEEEVRVENEIEEVLGLIGHELKLNNIEIKKEFPKDFPSICADKKQIEEILFNIIRNAAQAMDAGRAGKIILSGSSQNGSALIRISDNGSGIPQDKIGQIFNPFYTTKAPGKGTGLGLFIVKQVVERNKGTISVESEEGAGTTFTLTFPSSQSPVDSRD